MVKAKKKKDGPLKVGDLLSTVLGRFGLAEKMREHEVLIIWEEAVGKLVAKNSRPKSIAGGILVVETKDNVWMQELSLLRQGIIDKINELLDRKVVKDLHFKIGSLKEEENLKPVKAEPKKKKPVKVSQRDEKEMERVLAGYDDPELKGALKSMMIRGIERDRKLKKEKQGK